MATDVHRPDAFIAYPTNRVVGTIADPTNARAAIEALLHVGFTQEEIEILHREEDLHRPDPAAGEHRFLAQFRRTVTRKLAGEYKHLRIGEEFEHLHHYVEDVQAGRSVIMVLAKKRTRREAAVDILCSHGARLVEFYGRWSWQPLEPHRLPDPTPGRTYEAQLGGTATRVRWDSDSSVTILARSTGSPDRASDRSDVPVTRLRPYLLMIVWQEADRTTHVHIYDFESGASHAVVSDADGGVQRESGTVRRVD